MVDHDPAAEPERDPDEPKRFPKNASWETGRGGSPAYTPLPDFDSQATKSPAWKIATVVLAAVLLLGYHRHKAPLVPPQGPAAVALGVQAFVPVIRKAEVEGEWAGQYYYPGSGSAPPVAFRAVILAAGPAFSGRVTEPATFGDGTSRVLTADILDGSVAATGAVRFVKKYDGTGGVKHSLDYRGTISPDGKTILGTWTMSDGTSGGFRMTR